MFIMTHLVTRSQLARLARFTPFIHRWPRPSLTTKIPRSQTVILPHFSTKTFNSNKNENKTFPKCRQVQSPALDAQPAESSKVDSDPRPLPLPEDLSRNVVVLSCESTAEGGVCDVYLVGTNHVSKESSRQVQAIVKFLKPEAVFLELCESRMAVLTIPNFKPPIPTMGEMITMLKQKHNMFEVLLCWFLAKIASKLEVLPGSEFRVAYEEAIKYGGKVILGDRPVQITMERTWSKMSLSSMKKVLYFLFSKADFLQPSSNDLNKLLKDLIDSDKLTLHIQEMSKEFPTLMEPLVHERDQYMSCVLLKVASDSRSVVAVVGKGHLQGIKKNWKQPVVMQDLITVPSPKRGVITSVGVAIAGVAMISGIYLSCNK